MSIESLAQHITALLAALADPVRAAPMSAYMRHRFAYLGIPTPLRRQALRPILKILKAATADELLDLARLLWASPHRECQYAAIDILARHWKTLRGADVATVLALVSDKSWWDTVDALAGVIGDLIRRERTLQESMDAELHSPDLWRRRVAMIHQLGWRADTDTNRLFSYARQLAPEREFFIRKAIGWALRDYAWHDPEAIRRFLHENGAQLSPLSKREAGKNLGAAESLAIPDARPALCQNPSP